MYTIQLERPPYFAELMWFFNEGNLNIKISTLIVIFAGYTIHMNHKSQLKVGKELARLSSESSPTSCSRAYEGGLG